MRDAIPSCENCGACCMGMGFPPFGVADWDAEDSEYQALQEDLRHELDRIWDDRGIRSFAGSACCWFDPATRRCKHYEHRPAVCRDFEPGNLICLEDRALRGVD